MNDLTRTERLTLIILLQATIDNVNKTDELVGCDYSDYSKFLEGIKDKLKKPKKRFGDFTIDELVNNKDSADFFCDTFDKQCIGCPMCGDNDTCIFDHLYHKDTNIEIDISGR